MSAEAMLGTHSSTMVSDSFTDPRQGPQALYRPVQPWAFNAAVASEIAELALLYWRDCSDHAEINPDKPMDIIDFAPGSGISAHQILSALARLSCLRKTSSFRYLPVITDMKWVDQCMRVPELQAYLASGRICPLLVKKNFESPKIFQHGLLLEYHCDNPSLILTHNLWAKLSQRLLAVHYGKLLEADLALIQSGQSASEQHPHWNPADLVIQNSPYKVLIERYLREFNSAPIPLPEQALNILSHWRRIARHGYLMVSMGQGMASDLDFRLTRFPDIFSVFREASELPINFQWLAHWASMHAIAVEEKSLHDGAHLQLFMEAPSDLEPRIKSYLHQFNGLALTLPNLAKEIKHSMADEKKLAIHRQIFELSCWDPEVFSDLGRELTQSLAKTQQPNRAAWREGLEQVWSNFLPEISPLVLHEKLATAAMHCGHWGLARRTLLRGMHCHGENATDLANLAWCEARTGQIRLAEDLVIRALQIAPSNPLALKIQEKIQERLAHRDGYWLTDLVHDQLPITLEPLDQSHAESYFAQYRDPQIAIMTGLPALNSIDDTRRWIAEQSLGVGRVNFSVMHRDFGFVGFINLAVSAHASFFCFWTGVDFQGLGIATAAGRLACRYAASLGISVMLTSAYQDNARSIRALERIGFQAMSIRAAMPDQDRLFFSMVDPILGHIDVEKELMDYYTREKLPIKFNTDLKHDETASLKKKSSS
jgi:RimJ/RimL family protein N-acetyltransferase